MDLLWYENQNKNIIFFLTVKYKFEDHTSWQWKQIYLIKIYEDFIFIQQH